MISIESKDGRKSKPTALNTVEMLKVGSQNLGLGPSHVMQLAERLYIAGYISYPRTETSRYPESFDVQAAVQEQRKSDSWFVVLIRDLSLEWHRARHSRLLSLQGLVCQGAAREGRQEVQVRRGARRPSAHVRRQS